MDIKAELNLKQGQAATSDSQYLRIIAGAGTGKTRTLTYRIAYLLTQGVDPRRIVAITFTNKVAKEMKERVRAILEKENFHVSGYPLIATFHGFCYRFLRKEIGALDLGYNTSFSILEDDDQNTIYKNIFSQMAKGGSKDFCKAVVSKIGSLKTDGKYPEDVFSSDVPIGSIYTFDELMHVYTGYQDYLRRQNLIDFDDLLILTEKIMRANERVRAVWQCKFSHFLVDEFQDTNVVQYNLLRLFMGPHTYLTVVGDPDQTIYTWRGAKNEIIKDRLQKDFPSLETVVLDENYRSTQSILDRANKLIDCNKDRMKKDLVAASGTVGDKVTYNTYFSAEEEARGVARTISSLVRNEKATYGQFAVIYRANYLSNALEKQLTLYKIPYQIYGGLKFFERAEIKDALAYLKLAINPDDLSFQRILKAPSKGVGAVTLERAKELEQAMGDEGNLLSVFRDRRDDLRLTSSTKLALNDFYSAYDRFVNVVHNHTDAETLVSGITAYFEGTGYMAYVRSVDRKETDKRSFTASTSTSRVDNLNELLRTIQSFFETDYLDEEGKPREPQLEDFLIEVALQSDQDTMEESEKVSLMTGHVSKGLEFPYVFVTGLNENVFPSYHAVSSYSRSAIEEERRLCYVCMTRAQKHLYCSSFGGKDFIHGSNYVASRFVKEAGLLEERKETRPDYSAALGIHRPSAQVGIAPKSFLSQAGSLKRQDVTEDSYVAGDKVVHTNFGVGTVTKVEGKKITVQFAAPYGEKKLIVGFKAFRKLKEE